MMQNNTNSSTMVIANAPDTFSKVVTSVYVVTSATSVIGNGLVIFIMFRGHTHRRITLFKGLLAHLAFCDLLFAISLFADIPTWLCMKWIYGNIFCKIIPSSQLLTSLAAEGTIVVIAIERFKGISNPLNEKWTTRKLVMALSIAWTIAGASVSPYVIVLKVKFVYGQPQCMEDWGGESVYDRQKPLIYSLYLFICGFIIPMFILACLYGRVILILLRKPRVNNKEFAKLLEKRRKKDIRITRLLIAVVLAFVLFILPNHIGHIVSLTTKNLTATEPLQYITLIPYPFHCSVNPIIYSIVDVKFRRELKNCFLCKNEMMLRSTSTRIRRTTSSDRKHIPLLRSRDTSFKNRRMSKE